MLLRFILNYYLVWFLLKRGRQPILENQSDLYYLEQALKRKLKEGHSKHHLAPELKHFQSFTYSDYVVDVKLNGNYAYTIETYIYTIVLEKDTSEIKSRGVATSVLRKIKNEWKIEMTHGSYRKINAVTAQKK